MKKFCFLTCYLLLVTCHLSAQDFGVILDQTLDFNAHGAEFTDSRLDYSGVLIPRFSMLLTDDAEIVVSLGLNYQADPFAFVPELLRTDFTFRFGPNEIRAGRMPYRDPTGLIADGLFDGARYAYDTSAGTLSAGVWYTGLLYKQRASIEMTDAEMKANYAEIDYDDFANTYFAPGRVLAALGWEHPALAGFINMKVALLGQFDASGAEVNSYYLAAKMAMPAASFIFDLGGSLELVDDSGESALALEGDVGITWVLPVRSTQLVSLRGRFTSGVAEDGSLGAFLPLTAVQQGSILKPKLTGLSLASLDYTARLHQSFSLNVAASYFMRSDLGTYKQYPVIAIDSDGFMLGMEFYGKLLWSISSDIQMNLGFGAFLPALGDAAPDADALWRAELNIVFLLF